MVVKRLPVGFAPLRRAALCPRAPALAQGLVRGSSSGSCAWGAGSGVPSCSGTPRPWAGAPGGGSSPGRAWWAQGLGGLRALPSQRLRFPGAEGPPAPRQPGCFLVAGRCLRAADAIYQSAFLPGNGNSLFQHLLVACS